MYMMLLYINRYLYRSPTFLTSDYFVRSNEIVRTQISTAMKNDILMKYILILRLSCSNSTLCPCSKIFTYDVVGKGSKRGFKKIWGKILPSHSLPNMSYTLDGEIGFKSRITSPKLSRFSLITWNDSWNILKMFLINKKIYIKGK